MCIQWIYSGRPVHISTRISYRRNGYSIAKTPFRESPSFPRYTVIRVIRANKKRPIKKTESIPLGILFFFGVWSRAWKTNLCLRLNVVTRYTWSLASAIHKQQQKILNQTKIETKLNPLDRKRKKVFSAIRTNLHISVRSRFDYNNKKGYAVSKQLLKLRAIRSVSAYELINSPPKWLIFFRCVQSIRFRKKKHFWRRSSSAWL